ncbi:MAG: IclR family transcriptional regulator [Spirochaetia bacterium]|jgi:DNA-binding IclR family transcriptional regulator|nr:IclR family transcriptional regulator [Spirochaetia bacterium]
MAVDNDKYSIKAVMRCFQILDFAADHNGPISIPDVCTALDTNSNMAFRLLNSLESSGYMVKDATTGLYSVSLKTLKLSRRALQSLVIRKVTMPYLELLWNQYPKANANMAVFHQDEVLMLDRVDTQTTPRTYFTPGRVLPFHCSGLGKVLTCSLPEKEIDKLIKEKGLKKYTENTITDPDRLKEELRKVKEEGVGRDRNEFMQGDNCSAVPIFGHEGAIVAAISLSSLSTNMSADEIEAAIPVLKDTATKISYVMGFGAQLL